MKPNFPLSFSVEYPNRALNRPSTFFRLILVIPILILATTVTDLSISHNVQPFYAASGGMLFGGPLLMIAFRQKYPKWWFDWNLELLRFTTRIWIYLSLMSDQYPSTDQQQSVHLDVIYPDVKKDLNRYMPLIKWFLAIPHYIVLIFLNIAAFIGIILAWFSILFTERYPKSIFDFVEGVVRWDLRVYAYAFMLVTDIYPRFSLTP